MTDCDSSGDVWSGPGETSSSSAAFSKQEPEIAGASAQEFRLQRVLRRRDENRPTSRGRPPSGSERLRVPSYAVVLPM